MDNNNPQMPPVQPIPVPNTSPLGIPQVMPQPVPPSGGGSKKMLVIIVSAFLVVAILLGVGIFMYLRAQKTNPELQNTTNQNAQVLNNLSTDIKNVDIATPGADFSSVDKDLNSL